jgi:geranylgeranyl pyrophosphate synthase
VTVTEPITAYLARRAEEVNAWLDRLVPSADLPPRRLHQAMRYTLFAGGKRLRPTLLLAAGEAFGAY